MINNGNRSKLTANLKPKYYDFGELKMMSC